jgi:peptidoglycan/LPS O-acetylase OafA/YrhL
LGEQSSRPVKSKLGKHRSEPFNTELVEEIARYLFSCHTLLRMDHPQDHGHIRALDGIRGFALLMVFAYHALTNTIQPVSPASRLLHRAVMTGWIGVDLFFVLSGFLITTILMDARPAENYFKVFYIRRGLRIFPLYYAVLIATVLAQHSHIQYKIQFFFWLNLSNLTVITHLGTIGPLQHFWSLAIEEQFYLVWPSAVRWIRTRMLAYLCAAIILGLFIVRNLPPILALDVRWPELIYRFTLFRVDTLCAGALLAILAKYWPNLSRYRGKMRILCVCAGCVFLAVGFGREHSAPSVSRFGYTALVVCFTSLVALALYPGSIIARIFSNAFLRKTGKYSYCFYLLHPFLVNFLILHKRRVDSALPLLRMQNVSHNLIEIVLFVLEFVVLFGMCAISWNCFEGPILRLKRHFRYKPVPEHLLA